MGVWRPKGERFSSIYVKPLRQSGRITQNSWGWHGGRGELVPLTRNLNADLYVELLDEHLYPALRRVFPGRGQIFVIEDNSPVHTAHIVREWYDRHPRLVRLPHPPRSPGKKILLNYKKKICYQC